MPYNLFKKLIHFNSFQKYEVMEKEQYHNNEMIKMIKMVMVVQINVKYKKDLNVQEVHN